MKKAGKTTSPRKKAAKRTAVGKTAKQKAGAKKSAVIKRTVPAPAAAPAGVPNIDYSLCQGCGGCAELYPHLFEMRAERAWLIDAKAYDPVRDSAILKICPYYAISIEKV